MRGTGIILAATLIAGSAQGQTGGYRVGQAVEVEASGHWVPCRVAEVTLIDGDPVVRAQCAAYPPLSRAAGTYLVHNLRSGIRPATGSTGAAPARPVPAAPVPAKSAPAAAGGSLQPGEYACYGSGGRIMAGLGFKLLPGGRYTDLDGGNPGRASVGGGTIRFVGGHLDGQVGREVKGNGFRIGAQASCERWG